MIQVTSHLSDHERLITDYRNKRDITITYEITTLHNHKFTIFKKHFTSYMTAMEFKNKIYNTSDRFDYIMKQS